MDILPHITKKLARLFTMYTKGSDTHTPAVSEKAWSYLTLFLATFCLSIVVVIGSAQGQKLISPLVAPLSSLDEDETKAKKTGYEVFGFAPHWKINNLETVDFDVLTTFAYFGIPVTGDGYLDTTDQGYRIFYSKKATEVFKKAHNHGTRVVLTITQLRNEPIDAFLVNPAAQERAIEQTVTAVKERGIDGINIDFEYVGNPGSAKREAFTRFVQNITKRMHEEVPGSKVTVSVYASSASSTPKLYDISEIAKASDGIFMMAYDFAVASSTQAMPTAPLYGKKEGVYAYDIESSVNDFLKLMPADKLILGVPYYGLNFVVTEPRLKAQTRPASWRGRSTAQTYEYARNNVKPDRTGWDDIGKVGWEAYYVEETGTWRILFLDDARSLGLKYDFVKEKGLAGAGMWALGFDNGKQELWALLKDKFGTKSIAHTRVSGSTIR